MTLSKFIKLMYEAIGNENTQSDFVLYLFSLIVEEPRTDEDCEADDSGKYNPLADYKKNTLSKIFSGNAILSKNNAKIYLRHLDKSKLIDAIDNLGYDQIEKLIFELDSEKFNVDTTNISQYVADIFETLIKNATNSRQEVEAAEIVHREGKGKMLVAVPTRNVYYDEGKIHILENEILTKSKEECLSEEEPIEEQEFVSALIEVIAEKVGIHVSEVHINDMDKGLKRFYERQIENYVEALWLRHSIRDSMKCGDDVFVDLENETFSGIEEVYMDEYSSGYKRIKEVLKQVVCVSLDAVVVNEFSGLISNTVKKGVCHILVNDGYIKSWVNIDE